MQQNLVTGRTTFRENPGKATLTPRETFKIIGTTETQPRERRLRLGVVDVLITDTSIKFVATRRPQIFRGRGLRGRRGGLA